MDAFEATPWNVLYGLDFFAIALFLVSYYRNCYRRGYRFDIWHAELFLLFIFPNMVMLFFARNELNIIVLGRDFYPVLSVLPAVFLITLFGYFSVLAGGNLWALRSGIGVRKTVESLLDFIPRCSMMLMSSRAVLIFQAALCFFLQIIVLVIYFSQSGFGFDLRSFTFANPTLRPVALLISNYSIVIASHCLARYVDTKEKPLLACTLLVSFGLIFFGSRGNLFGVYISVLMCYLVRLRAKISLFKIGTLGISVLALAFYLGNVRAGQYSLGDFFASIAFLLLYGNNFSDLRDFAWVYSAWDHNFWAGKTYLAALVSFVPRFASGFRDTWALGSVTSTMIGFDPQEHPGVRPTMFGESYFNFGLIGVVAVGLMIGVVFRRVDIVVKRSFSGPEPSMQKAFASTSLLGVAGVFAVSAGFSGLYVLAGIYLFTWLCICAERVFRQGAGSLDHAR